MVTKDKLELNIEVTTINDCEFYAGPYIMYILASAIGAMSKEEVKGTVKLNTHFVNINHSQRGGQGSHAHP